MPRITHIEHEIPNPYTVIVAVHFDNGERVNEELFRDGMGDWWIVSPQALDDWTNDPDSTLTNMPQSFPLDAPRNASAEFALTVYKVLHS